MMRNVLLMAALIVTTGCATGTPGTIGSPTPMADGLLFYQDGRYVAAHDAFDQAVRRQPRSADAYANRGVTRLRLGNLTGAIEDLSAAIALVPRDPVLFYNRGNALVASGHPELAVGDYTRAVEINPLYARAWFNRGSAHALAGQHDAAAADWRHAMEIEPDPWTRYSMQRSARLAAVGPDPQGRPTTVGTVAPAPPPTTAPGAVPLPPAGERTPGTEPLARDPAASPTAIDARALAARGMSRELDGDRAGAIADLQAALELEPDPGRRAAITGLLQHLEAGR